MHPVVATCMAHHMVTVSCYSFPDVKTRKSIINGDNTALRDDRLKCRRGQELCRHFVSFVDTDPSKRHIHPKIFKNLSSNFGVKVLRPDGGHRLDNSVNK